MRRRRWNELVRRQTVWLEEHPRPALAIFGAAVTLLSGFVWFAAWCVTTPATPGQADQAIHVPTWQVFTVIEAGVLTWITWPFWKVLVPALWKTWRER